MNPTAVHSILERVTAEDDEGAEDHSLEEEEEEGAAHSLKDVCDFEKPEPSPFSSRRVMYENEEVSHSYKGPCTMPQKGLNTLMMGLIQEDCGLCCSLCAGGQICIQGY